jgi:hypothetical protein
LETDQVTEKVQSALISIIAISVCVIGEGVGASTYLYVTKVVDR